MQAIIPRNLLPVTASNFMVRPHPSFNFLLYISSDDAKSTTVRYLAENNLLKSATQRITASQDRPPFSPAAPALSNTDTPRLSTLPLFAAVVGSLGNFVPTRS